MVTLQVYKEQYTQSNCYILEDNGFCLIIDPNEFEKIDRVITEQKLTPEMILLTHEHCDHMAGLNALRKKYPVQVVASRACSEGIQNKRLNMSAMMEVYLYFRGYPGIQYEPFVCEAADTVFEETFQMEWRGQCFRMYRVPGHTPGSTCIFWNEDSLFSGDYLIPEEEVITRLPGGDSEAYETQGKAWLAKILPGTRIYPGHYRSYELTAEDKRIYGL